MHYYGTTASSPSLSISMVPLKQNDSFSSVSVYFDQVVSGSDIRAKPVLFVYSRVSLLLLPLLLKVLDIIYFAVKLFGGSGLVLGR